MTDQDNNSGTVASYVAPLLYKIHNEDCRTTLAKLPNECIDLVVTSPPYDDLRKYKGYEFNFEVFTEIAKELFRVMKAGGVIVWVVSDATRNGTETGTSFRQALFFKDICGFNLHDTMIYYRQSPYPSNVRYNQVFEYMFVLSKGQPNTFNPVQQLKSENSFSENVSSKTYRNKAGETVKPDQNAIERLSLAQTTILKTSDNIWYIPTGYMVGSKDVESFEHPATFPEKLAENHIISWSNPNDIVYDPFSGSGTTCKIADRLGRAWLGSDIAEEYCSVALQRIENDLFTKAST
ncbi:MAG: site-specific DNA-methyltransferase [Bacteroidota bacterium]